MQSHQQTNITQNFLELQQQLEEYVSHLETELGKVITAGQNDSTEKEELVRIQYQVKAIRYNMSALTNTITHLKAEANQANPNPALLKKLKNDFVLHQEQLQYSLMFLNYLLLSPNQKVVHEIIGWIGAALLAIGWFALTAGAALGVGIGLTAITHGNAGIGLIAGAATFIAVGTILIHALTRLANLGGYFNCALLAKYNQRGLNSDIPSTFATQEPDAVPSKVSTLHSLNHFSKCMSAHFFKAAKTSAHHAAILAEAKIAHTAKKQHPGASERMPNLTALRRSCG